ncbi:MAG TPA: hypothetical protein PK335_05380 [Draconibacterium sp.]|nr:hypothetical protein [Draconibacterium sp.]
MKAIILVSSIFYILGLKISNTINLVKHQQSSVEKVIIHEASPVKKEKSLDITKSDQVNTVQDSASGGGMTDKILESK